MSPGKGWVVDDDGPDWGWQQADEARQYDDEHTTEGEACSDALNANAPA